MPVIMITGTVLMVMMMTTVMLIIAISTVSEGEGLKGF